MYCKLAALFSLSVFAAVNADVCNLSKTVPNDKAMSNHGLTLSVACKGEHGCEFVGKDIFFELVLTNNGREEVGFPLEFAQEKGPGVKLIDIETKRESYLSTHLADWALKEDFIVIPPGGSVSFEWVVMESELTQFGHKYVDVAIEFSIGETIRVNDEKVEYSAESRVRVSSREKLKERQVG